MKPNVFIDGKEGTTGLQIYERLGGRTDVNLLLIDEEKRKDPEARLALMRQSDIVFLCLPDAAAVEAAALAARAGARVIDASTAHRTDPDWVYGFAELSPQQPDRIRSAPRVANPGCHATGFISAVAPLTGCGLLAKDTAVHCFSLTGYSGGGKKMIAQYEVADRPAALDAPRIYGLSLNHKHLPEMQAVCELTVPPIFLPVVDDYYKGMATTVALDLDAVAVHAALEQHYATSPFVKLAPLGYTEAMIAANTLAGTDGLLLIVCGDHSRCTVTALFDNLGKGASGAAVQNMNLMLGLPETAGLNLPAAF